ncbi:MAG: hypothetical protein ACKPKO_63025 [Candidatus Fonsibacter sp.]
MNQYQGKIIVVLGDCAEEAAYALKKGSQQGAPFATYFIQGYGMKPYGGWKARHPQLWLFVFIDDLFVMGCGQSRDKLTLDLADGGGRHGDGGP